MEEKNAVQESIDTENPTVVKKKKIGVLNIIICVFVIGAVGALIAACFICNSYKRDKTKGISRAFEEAVKNENYYRAEELYKLNRNAFTKEQIQEFKQKATRYYIRNGDYKSALNTIDTSEEDLCISIFDICFDTQGYDVAEHLLDNHKICFPDETEKQLRDKIQQAIYEEGVGYYKNGLYADAKDCFERISDSEYGGSSNYLNKINNKLEESGRAWGEIYGIYLKGWDSRAYDSICIVENKEQIRQHIADGKIFTNFFTLLSYNKKKESMMLKNLTSGEKKQFSIGKGKYSPRTNKYKCIIASDMGVYTRKEW